MYSMHAAVISLSESRRLGGSGIRDRLRLMTPFVVGLLNGHFDAC